MLSEMRGVENETLLESKVGDVLYCCTMVKCCMRQMRVVVMKEGRVQ